MTMKCVIRINKQRGKRQFKSFCHLTIYINRENIDTFNCDG